MKSSPHPNDKSGTVVIKSPSVPTPTASWSDPAVTATFVPGGQVPTILNGIPFQPVKESRTHAQWENLVRGASSIELPKLQIPPGKEPAAGAVILEPDGRVWYFEPTNHYGGYVATFPKGRREPGFSDAATAAKETLEETGLLIEIGNHLCDTVRSTTVCRYFLARRIGGSPAEMGWEAQSVSLGPLVSLKDRLPSPADRPILEALAKCFKEAQIWVSYDRQGL
jgi:8-oxo-dGTP pyrophosphatase MutT (NUDIX family)